MHDAEVMGRLQDIAELDQHLADPLRSEPATLAEQPLEQPAAQILHHQEHAGRIVHEAAMELDDMRVLKSAQDLDFAAKPLAHGGLGNERLLEDLDHDLRAANNRMGQIEPAHAALAQETVDAEAIEECSANHRRTGAGVG